MGLARRLFPFESEESLVNQSALALCLALAHCNEEYTTKLLTDGLFQVTPSKVFQWLGVTYRLTIPTDEYCQQSLQAFKLRQRCAGCDHPLFILRIALSNAGTDIAARTPDALHTLLLRHVHWSQVDCC